MNSELRVENNKTGSYLLHVKFVILNFKFSVLLFVFTLFLAINVNAQLVITDPSTLTLTDLINKIVGQGVKVTSKNYTGSIFSRSFFDRNNSNIGITGGIILSTGDVKNAVGPNNDWGGTKGVDFKTNSNDVDLEAIVKAGGKQCNNCLHDPAILEFDFIPEASQISFHYVFASEEYPEWVCSKYNDVFGFFLTGANPQGGNYNSLNIALIQPTNFAVAINSINSGNVGIDPALGTPFKAADCTSLLYSSLFVNNGDGSTPAANPTVQYDGFTVMLTAVADVIPCTSYHIKLALADVTDGNYDSAIFLEENSFKSPRAVINTTFTHSGIDTAAIEGCTEIDVCFNISSVQANDQIVKLTYSGAAASRADMQALPPSVNIKAGQTQACIKIQPQIDGITQGLQLLKIKAGNSLCSSDSFQVYITDNTNIGITANPTTASICKGQSVKLTVSGNGGITKFPYKYAWSNGVGGNLTTVNVSPTISTTYTVTVKDTCGTIATVQIPVTVNPIPIVGLTKDTTICAGSTAKLTATGAGAGGKYVWSSGEKTAQIFPAPLTTTTYIVTVTTAAACSSSSQVVVTVNQLPAIGATAKNDKLCSGAQVEIDATGGTKYLWSSNPNDPSLVGKQTLANPIVAPLQTTTYTVTGTDAVGCSNTASVVVNVKSPPVAPLKDTTICAGDKAILEVKVAGVGIFYLWSTLETTSSITVTPIVKTTYTVTVTEPTFGCSTTVSAVVDVNPMPMAEAGADVAICSGDKTTLNASGAGATGSYSWSNGVKVAANSVQPNINTKYIVTVTDAIGCSAKDSLLVTVNPNPVVTVLKDTIICAGFSVDLTAVSNNVAYSWFPGGSTTQTINVTPAVTTTYTVTVTDINKCTATSKATVTVNPKPVLTGQSKEICFGKSVTLNINSTGNGLKYLWSNGDVFSSITVSPIDIINITSYSVTVTDINGCVNDTILTVKVWENPVAQLPADFFICEGKSILLTANGAGVNGSYLWSPGGETNQAININPTITTIYSVTVTDIHNCQDSAKVQVEVNNNPTAHIERDTAICAGDTATLSGSGGVKYLWSTNDTIATIRIAPDKTTDYFLTVTDAGGCIGTGKATISVNQIPTSTFSVVPSPVCVNQQTFITFTGSASQNATFKWIIDGDSSKTDRGPLPYSWDSTGVKTITLIVTDNKCVSIITTNVIQINTLPVANFYALNKSGCEPLTVQFIDSSYQTNATSKYKWNFGDGSVGDGKNMQHTYFNSGKYTVTLTVSNAVQGCDDIKVISNIVDVWQNPEADYIVQPDSIISELFPYVSLQAVPYCNECSYYWKIGNSNKVLTGSNVEDYELPGVGKYPVTLVVSNKDSCKTIKKGIIIVKEDFTLYVPNAFRPSNCKANDGQNNCNFNVKGINIQEFSIKIFNRWGNLMYSYSNSNVVTTSYDIWEGWDGKINGSIVPEGIYVYIIDYKDVTRRRHTLNGYLTLIK